MAKRKPKGWRGESRRHSLASRGIKTAQNIPNFLRESKKGDGKTDYFRNPDGKISDTKLSPYGKRQLDLIDGAGIDFIDGSFMIDDDKLINIETGKVAQKIDNDRLVNKLVFKIL